MKNWIAFILFVLIATPVSMGVEELLDSLNQEYLWNLSERAVRWIYIIVSCAISFPLANYLSEKIKQLRK